MATEGEMNRLFFNFVIETCQKTVYQSSTHHSNEKKTNLSRRTSKKGENRWLHIDCRRYFYWNDFRQLKMLFFWLRGKKPLLYIESMHSVLVALRIIPFVSHSLISLLRVTLSMQLREWPSIEKNRVTGRPACFSRTPLLSLFVLEAKDQTVIGERSCNASQKQIIFIFHHPRYRQTVNGSLFLDRWNSCSVVASIKNERHRLRSSPGSRLQQQSLNLVVSIIVLQSCRDIYDSIGFFRSLRIKKNPRKYKGNSARTRVRCAGNAKGKKKENKWGEISNLDEITRLGLWLV